MSKYAGINTISTLIETIKTNFSPINHTHTVVDIESLQDTIDTLNGNVDILEQTVANLEGNINPEVSFKTETLNFTLIDGTTISKQVLVK